VSVEGLDPIELYSVPSSVEVGSRTSSSRSLMRLRRSPSLMRGTRAVGSRRAVGSFGRRPPPNAVCMPSSLDFSPMNAFAAAYAGAGRAGRAGDAAGGAGRIAAAAAAATLPTCLGGSAAAPMPSGRRAGVAGRSGAEAAGNVGLSAAGGAGIAAAGRAAGAASGAAAGRGPSFGALSLLAGETGGCVTGLADGHALAPNGGGWAGDSPAPISEGLARSRSTMSDNCRSIRRFARR